MKPWFSTAERVATLRAEAESWLRTPFCLHSQAKGAGVDCVHLDHALATSTGWPHVLTPPDYGAQDTMHSPESKLHAYLDAAAGIELVGEFPAVASSMRVGDIITFIIGKAAHHTGMVISGTRFVHAMSNHVVKYSDLGAISKVMPPSRLYRLTDVAGPEIESKA